ncbi:putative haloacetate dehalogenase H-1 [Hyaloraphidium curvatum]|nr:putative haloacetate dehalogenase H-1 [Hyaloraphidium curvatum]
MFLFAGFREAIAEVNGASIRYKVGGSGPPLLLLHGNPQTLYIWHAVAAALSATHTVVCSDLRGYGRSTKPAHAPAGADAEKHPMSKRNMARDQVALMRSLGFDRFSAAGHDRGGRVLHRLIIDHPGVVVKAAVLDIVPTITVWETMTMKEAMGYHHWLFLAQPAPMPEKLISAVDGGRFWWLDHCAWGKGHTMPAFFHKEAVEDYLECFASDEAIRGMCEDYRAAATVDLELDRATLQAQKIDCPLLVLWGRKGRVNEWYQPLEVWKGFVASGQPVQGAAVQSGHYVPEEAAEETIEWFKKFFV